MTVGAHRHYNPDWLSDADLAANFVARQDEYAFLRGELARAPRQGSVQHYLLVGLRGAGKTTLLKRLAVAIRSDADLADHLIALSFPEELYQVKHLADFWWAACEALADALDRRGDAARADRVQDAVERRRERSAEPLDDAGYVLMQQTCAEIGRRPVLLVDNLDMVFQRIDKRGRKLKDPHAPAYWALREALSTATSPIVVGGSVRLSEPFTDYDKAFYDFFMPRRLGRLSLAEVRSVIERLAAVQGVPEVRQRLHARPARVEALYELTGGNPRALGLIFELLRQGADSRAVEDFERLMDITTPYYKARFEDLSEQAQVVMHALAVRRPGDGSALRFGHTAAEIGNYAGLPTGTVSAQLDAMEREGLVEKSAARGRMQYRIAEQLFRLWLQMRATRRVRENVVGLTEFLEAMFDAEELQAMRAKGGDAAALVEAKYSFAMAATCSEAPLRRSFEVQGTDQILRHIQDCGGSLDEYLPKGDLSDDLRELASLRERLCKKHGCGLSDAEQDVLLGSLELRLERKQASVDALCDPNRRANEVVMVRQQIEREQRRLLSNGLLENDLPMLFAKRARGNIPLPWLTPTDAEAAFALTGEPTFRQMVWRLVGARQWVKVIDDAVAQVWLEWGLNHLVSESAFEWANVAGALRRSKCFDVARQALDKAFSLGACSRTWYEKGAWLYEAMNDLTGAEEAVRRAIELDTSDAWPWNTLGHLLSSYPNRLSDAECAYRQAIRLDPTYALPWNGLGNLLSTKPDCFDDAESAYQNSIELDPTYAFPWNGLGNLLSTEPNRFYDAEKAYRTAIDLDSSFALPWNGLGNLLSTRPGSFKEAELAYHKAIELDQGYALPWNNLGAVLASMSRLGEAEMAFRRAIDLDPKFANPWNGLGWVLVKLERLDDASRAFAHAATLDSKLHSFLKDVRANLEAHRCALASKPALGAGDLSALRAALSDLLNLAGDVSAAVVSKHFVEGLLAPALADGKGTALLGLLRELGYDKHARPLLLAFEAALARKPEQLDDLEPEVREAARRMYARLTAPSDDAAPPT